MTGWEEVDLNDFHDPRDIPHAGGTNPLPSPPAHPIVNPVGYRGETQDGLLDPAGPEEISSDIVPAQRTQPRHDDPDSASPFAGVAPVDAIVYSRTTHDPELSWDGSLDADVPLPPARPEPAPLHHPVSHEPWQPGPPVDPAMFRKTASPARIPLAAFALGIIPIGLLIGVVYLVMTMYGYAG